MKKHTIGVFAAREDAEKAINYIHNEFNVPNEEISYVYKNTAGQIAEVDADEVSSDTPMEGAGKGASAGAVLGAIAGVAVAAGVAPVIGPLLVAGPLLTALGVTGVVGSAAAGAVSGAAVGGLIGALMNLGVGEEKAQKYQDQVAAGNILVAVHTETENDIESVFIQNNATDVETYTIEV